MKEQIRIDNLSTDLYFPSNTPIQIVIGVHGFFGDKQSSVLVKLGNELIKNNMALITFDLPCHGLNNNSQTLKLSDCVKSIKSIFNWAHKNFPNTPLSLFATSFGGYLSLLYLSQHDENLNKIILRAPAINMSHVLENVLLPFQSLSAEDLKTTKDIGKEQSLLVDYSFIEELRNNKLQNKKTTQNFLNIIQGRKDDIVNPKDNEIFLENFYKGKHKIIYFENADHRFKKPGELEKIIDETLNILN